MNYTCSGSWTTADKVISTLPQFNFSNSFIHTDYTAFPGGFNKVKDDINAGRVTFLEGQNSKIVKPGIVIFRKRNLEDYYYDGGHGWLCDGYRIENGRNNKGEIDCSKKTYYLHMNWGFENANSQIIRYNGYYVESTWAPNTTSYNYQHRRKIITNIKP